MRRTLSTILISLFLSIPSIWAIGFSPDADSLSARLRTQRMMFPQEKIHVTTDRSQYMGGDTIWFRAFVVDATTNIPVAESRYVYVELLTPFGFLDKRVKVIERKGVYAGYIPLDMEMAEGDYTLAAYTTFMEDPGEDFYFKKKVRVFSPMATERRIDAAFSPDGNEGDLKVELSFRDRKTGELAQFANMHARTSADKELSKRDGDGVVKMSLKNKDRGAGSLLVTFNNYSKYIPIPASPANGRSVDLSFHPEGGYLIDGVLCKVAHKAIGTDGLARSVSGKIVDSQGNEVAKLNSSHAGMGVAAFIPRSGETYRAIYHEVGANDNVEYSDTLPAVEEKAAVIHAFTDNSKRIAMAAFGNVPAGSTMALVQRGNLLYSTPAIPGRHALLDGKKVSPGILQILLLDSLGQEISERLIFNRGEMPKLNMEKSEADGMTKVKIKVDGLAAGERGSVAVAVLNGNIVPEDSTSSIAASLLLQGKLRGHIEDPAWYFRNDGTDDALDALMLTQGWSRYDIPAAMRGEFTPTTATLERGVELSGQVKSLWRGKPMKDAVVNVISPKVGFAASAQTDKDGYFKIAGLDYPTDAKFKVIVYNSKGKKEMNFHIDNVVYPTVGILPSRATMNSFIPEEKTPEFIIGEGSRMAMINGTLNVLLNEVTITSTKQRNLNNTVEAFATQTMKSQDFENKNIYSLEDILRSWPGIILTNGNIYFHGNSLPIYVDKHRWTPTVEPSGSAMQNVDIYEVRYGKGSTVTKGRRFISLDYSRHTPVYEEFMNEYPLHTIKSVSLLGPGESSVLGAGLDGAISVETKKDADYRKDPVKSRYLQEFRPLGYQRKKSFFNPKYKVASDSQLKYRPTIYWNDNISTNKNGECVIELPKALTEKGTPIFIIEGMTNLGRILD